MQWFNWSTTVVHSPLLSYSNNWMLQSLIFSLISHLMFSLFIYIMLMHLDVLIKWFGITVDYFLFYYYITKVDDTSRYMIALCSCETVNHGHICSDVSIFYLYSVADSRSCCGYWVAIESLRRISQSENLTKTVCVSQ